MKTERGSQASGLGTPLGLEALKSIHIAQQLAAVVLLNGSNINTQSLKNSQMVSSPATVGTYHILDIGILMENMAFATSYIDSILKSTSSLFRIEIVLLFIVATFLLTNYASSKFQRRLPPGPRPLFLIKNLHQMPRSYPWRALQKWHEIYGPIISLQYGQRVMISIGSYKVAHDLLEKRKNIYDSRPLFVVSGKYMSKGLNTALIPSGAQWKTHRRLTSNFLSDRQIRSYREMQGVESKQLLYNLLRSEDFSGEFRRFSLSIIMTLAYGKRVESRLNPEIEELTRHIKNIATAMTKTTSGLVEAFPILDRLLPRWAAPWRRMGDMSFEHTSKFYMQHAQSSTPFSWARQISDFKEAQGLSPVALSCIIGVFIDGGMETTTSVLEFFTVASVLHPNSVGKAQEELDSVVGQNRLPSFDDTPNLPFVNAFIKEVLRWRPVLPMGLPHSPREDDEYLGYHIPKGALVVENQWAINLDNERFQDSHKFMPERWLQDPDQQISTFGFGRRTCPGKQIAQNSMFIAIARILWAYNISHYHINGKKVPIDPLDTKQTLGAGPSPFKASFSIRSPAHQRIVEQEWESTMTDVNVTMGQSIHLK